MLPATHDVSALHIFGIKWILEDIIIEHKFSVSTTITYKSEDNKQYHFFCCTFNTSPFINPHILRDMYSY